MKLTKCLCQVLTIKDMSYMMEFIRWFIFIKIVSQIVKGFKKIVKRFKKIAIKEIVIKKIIIKKIVIIEKDCDKKNSCL